MATVNKDLGPVTAYAYAKEGGYTGTATQFETDLADSANLINTIDEMISGKADKVSSATNNNFAALDANGNLKDSGHKHSDYLTQHQDISGKADKAVPSASGNVATLDANGNLVDSNKTLGKSVPSDAVFTDTNNAVAQTKTTGNSDYEVLFSGTADNTTRTEGARKNNNLKFNPSTGNLQATQLNGVTIGSSPKFTDTTYESKSASSGGTAVSLCTTGEKYTWNSKADKAVPSASGNVATLNSSGNLVDSGKTLGASVPADAVFTDTTYNVVSKTANGLAPQLPNETTTTKYLRQDGTWVAPPNTKNTAGSTDSSSKLYLIGATSQAANPQTYSQDTAYVGTDGNLYSGSKVVATQNMIGDAWVTSHAYAVGDYCIDGNVLYKCKTAHTSSASYRPPYASYWDAVSVASQLKKGAYSTVKSLKSCSTLTKGSINGDGYVFASDGQMSFTVNASGWFKLQCVSIDTLATGKKSLVVTINNFSIETINENDSIEAWAYCFNYFPPIWINAGDSVSVSIATTYAPKLWVHAVSSWVIS